MIYFWYVATIGLHNLGIFKCLYEKHIGDFDKFHKSHQGTGVGFVTWLQMTLVRALISHSVQRAVDKEPDGAERPHSMPDQAGRPPPRRRPRRCCPSAASLSTARRWSSTVRRNATGAARQGWASPTASHAKSPCSPPFPASARSSPLGVGRRHGRCGLQGQPLLVGVHHGIQPHQSPGAARADGAVRACGEGRGAGGRAGAGSRRAPLRSMFDSRGPHIAPPRRKAL